MRSWRKHRGLSQLDLALAAESSARHISFIENGRAIPGPAILHGLLTALDVPGFEREIFDALAGALDNGGEPRPTEPLSDDAIKALQLLLAGHDPDAAVAFDRQWNICMVNEAYARFLKRQLPGNADDIVALAPIEVGRLNALRLVLGPGGLRSCMENWSEVARALLIRVRRSLYLQGDDAAVTSIIREVIEDTKVQQIWKSIPLDASPDIVVPAAIRLGGEVVHLASTISTLGDSADHQLGQIRIEAFRPVQPLSNGARS